MSDPVSNADIEDVLSSIRRLISAGQSDQQDSDDADAPIDNKLILTPAFRVFEGDRADAVDAKKDDSTSQFSSGRDIPVESLEQSALAPEDSSAKAAGVEKTEELTPVGLSVDPEAIEPGLQSTAEMPMPPADSQVDFEDNWDSDAFGETAQVAFLHERLSRAAVDAAPEDAEEESPAVKAADPMIASQVDDTAEDDAAVVDVAAEQTLDQDNLKDDGASTDARTALEANGEALVDDAAADDDDDQPILDDTDSEDQTIDADFQDTDAQAVTGRVEIDEAPMAEIVEDDTDFIDEAYLQDIVSRIVRDELKGEIGVKITQAVRRMVRREVTRALSLEKFD